jgi:cytochrome bd ubiquinol oxidase subunit I
MPEPSMLVNLSRIQFGLTAMFHFLFVPLTLGLTWILVVMEGLYLKTKREVFRDMTQFWAKLLAINFAMGVITGMTLEFEFGQNWAYFSRLIGGSFGPILAIEGITAFMLETTMFGLFFFTWDRVSKKTHFAITFFMALGASLSIVNILAANTWMQHPIASHFDPRTVEMNLTSILALYSNAFAQVRIGHVLFAGFSVAAVFVMGISSYYLLKGRDIGFAKRSFSVAAGFGIVAMCSVAFFGDQNGLMVLKYEPATLAAMEGQWETHKAPSAWFLTAFPHQETQSNSFVIKIPWMLSLIEDHSLTGVVKGIKQIEKELVPRVKSGIVAYNALRKIRDGDNTAATAQVFDQHRNDIGYGFLVKKVNPTVENVTPAQIVQTTHNAIPMVWISFWAFRFMLGCWGLFFLGTLLSFVGVFRKSVFRQRWLLRCMLLFIPLPYIAAECGWIISEMGRQPWVVHGVLPTFMGVSNVPIKSVITSLTGYAIFYLSLFTIELVLMFKYARLGPSSLHTGRYHLEKQEPSEKGGQE